MENESIPSAAPRKRRFAQAERLVEAGLLDRLVKRRLLEKRNQYRQDFTSDVEGLNGDAGPVESIFSKNLYEPVMTHKGPGLRNMQDDLGEAAHKGGLGIGPGIQGYAKPGQEIADMNAMRLHGMGFLGKGFFSQLAQKLGGGAPQIAKELSTPRPISRGVFTVNLRVYTGGLADGKPMDSKAWKWISIDPAVTLAQPLRSFELEVQHPEVMNLMKTRSVSPQTLLNWHDIAQGGQDIGVKSGPSGAAWAQNMGRELGEILADDAARVGRTNLLIDVVKGIGTTVVALGAAVAVGMWGAGMANIEPSQNQIVTPKDKGQNDPFAATKSTDPAKAFAPADNVSAPHPTKRPFGAVNQGFGNLPSQGVDTLPLLPSNEQNIQNPYGWTRINAAAARVLTAQTTTTHTPIAEASPTQNALDALDAATRGLPTAEDVHAAFREVISHGDTPEGHAALSQFAQLFADYAPQIERFNQQASILSGISQPQQVEQAEPHSLRAPRFASRSEGSLGEAAGYNFLENNWAGSAAFLNPYGGQYNETLLRAQRDPRFAEWLRANPEYAQGINPETSSYYGDGAESAQTYRQVDPNENWEQELERDLQMMDGGAYQQWEAAQTNVQNQVGQYYGNSQLVDSNGSPIGPTLQNTYNNINPQGPHNVPQYSAATSQPKGVAGVAPLVQHSTWAQGQPAQYTSPSYNWVAGPSGTGRWAPSR